MFSGFRRRKTLLASVVLLLFFLAFQVYTNTSWKTPVITTLRKYHSDFKQSLDIPAFHFEKHKEVSAKKTENGFDPKTMSSLYSKAKSCLEKTRKQIAKYLQRSTESEFSGGFLAGKRITPVLEPKCHVGLDLIIVITTRPGGFFNRAAIRNGFGRMDSDINKRALMNTKLNYITVFTVGRDMNVNIERLVEGESDRFKDILRLDYQDTYENLSNKTILTMEWIANHCPPKFVLKTDDDCFVNVLAIAPWLHKQDASVKYIGRKNEWMPVIRDPLHRNYVPFDDFDEEYYKPYCAGGGYMLAGNILKNISIKARSIKQIINEDAYMGMVTNALNIAPKNDERFLPFIFSKHSTEKRPMCQWRNKFLMHGVLAEKQLTMHWNAIAMSEYRSICDLEPL